MDEAITMTMGVDLGDRWSHVCALDGKGEVVETTRVRTSPEGFTRLFGSRAHARVAVEVGAQSRWVSELLESLGHEVLVANARQVRLIYGGRHKDDQLDAEKLARLARFDPSLLAPIKHRGRKVQGDLAVIKARDLLVSLRTKLVNHIRATAKSAGQRLPSCDSSSFHRKVDVHSLPEELRLALGPLLEQMSTVTSQIKAYEKEIKRLAADEYPEARHLGQVTGVGALTALCFVLTIEDPHRFQKSRMVGAYLGLTPRRSQSGGKDPELGITKGGPPLLRKLLVQSAHYIMGPFGPDCELRRFGERLTARGKKNARKKALIAVARRLAVLLHRLWITGEVYEPLGYTEG